MLNTTLTQTTVFLEEESKVENLGYLGRRHPFHCPVLPTLSSHIRQSCRVVRNEIDVNDLSVLQSMQDIFTLLKPCGALTLAVAGHCSASAWHSAFSLLLLSH